MRWTLLGWTVYCEVVFFEKRGKNEVEKNDQNSTLKPLDVKVYKT